MTIHHQTGDVTVLHADCLDVLRDMPDNSIDSVVCDPPYGLEFMNKTWDKPSHMSQYAKPGENSSGFFNHTGHGRLGMEWKPAHSKPFQQWCELWAAETLRVLRPGGHLLAFGGTRTWHRLTCAIEDAGYEIRDSVAWMTGAGFPKSLQVGRAIDLGACREAGTHTDDPDHTCPATEDGDTWRGHGTALKPAHEPVVVARKPLDGTVAQSVLKWGTGALNVDACRIGTDSITQHGRSNSQSGSMSGRNYAEPAGRAWTGRWPANVVLDEDQAEALDLRSGTVGANGGKGVFRQHAWMETDGTRQDIKRDKGGASRFFLTASADPLPIEALQERFMYTAKAPKSERPIYEREGGGNGRVTGLGGKVRQCNVCQTRAIESGAGEPSCGHGDYRWAEPTSERRDVVSHPTVKPLSLMRWLVRLVTPPGGTCLDPFAGSGATIEAALLEGFNVIGIEREAEYLPLIMQRIQRVEAARAAALLLPDPEPSMFDDDPTPEPPRQGRWPANVVLDRSQAEALDQQSGISKDGVAVRRNRPDGTEANPNGIYGSHKRGPADDQTYGGQGGASRFFMTVDSDDPDEGIA